MSTILLIPGMWNHPGAARLQDTLTQRGHEVVLVTLPGEDSEQSPNPIGVNSSLWTDQIAAVNQALDRLKPGLVPILIGESTGGLIAQTVASRRNTGPLVLLNSPAPGGMYQCLPFLLFSMLKQAFGRSSRRAFREMNFPACRDENSRIDSSRITVPMLIISGAKDKIIPRSVSLNLFRLYSQADYQRFATCGHRVFEDAAGERIFRDIGDWIEALEHRDFPVDLQIDEKNVTGRCGLHHQAPAHPVLPPVTIPAAKAARGTWHIAGSREIRTDAHAVAD